jgi:hypothetical protein
VDIYAKRYDLEAEMEASESASEPDPTEPVAAHEGEPT